MRTATIGEVLGRLQEEFEDVTISKIRFLESEGLISPDRTDSGYRKFTDEDVERLRYILRAQRDRYLPLKVIRRELERLDAGLLPAADAGHRPEAPDGASGHDDGPRPLDDEGAGGSARSLLDDPDPRLETHDRTELAARLGLDDASLRALQDHGIVDAGDRLPPDEVEAARLAAHLLGQGLEPRHLRMYRQFADREAALYEQLVTPLLRQRNPDSRAEAVDRLAALHGAGGRLRDLLLARRLRGLLRS